MTPLFFGDADKPLFGVHHQPTSSQFQDVSIVLCNPIGFEYGRAHIIMRSVANQLAQIGYHVLRFDYYATGDSSGFNNQSSVSQWEEDLITACDEVKAISATRKTSVIAYRFGALIACEVAKRYKFNKLILWDPVINGQEYLHDLQLMHEKMLLDLFRFDPKYMSTSGDSAEMIGFDFHEGLRNEICELKLSSIDKIKTRKIEVFSYDDGYQVESIIDESNFLNKANMHLFEGTSEWMNPSKIESKVLPDSSITELVKVIG